MCDVRCLMMTLPQALLLSHRGEVRAVVGGGNEPAVVMTIGGGVVVDDAAMRICSSNISNSISSVTVCASLSHFSCCSNAFAHRNASLWGSMQAAMAAMQSAAENLAGNTCATLLQRYWLGHVMRRVTRQQAFRDRNSLQDTREMVRDWTLPLLYYCNILCMCFTPNYTLSSSKGPDGSRTNAETTPCCCSACGGVTLPSSTSFRIK
jgi:hypothetical protein